MAIIGNPVIESYTTEPDRIVFAVSFEHDSAGAQTRNVTFDPNTDRATILAGISARIDREAAALDADLARKALCVTVTGEDEITNLLGTREIVKGK